MIEQTMPEPVNKVKFSMFLIIKFWCKINFCDFIRFILTKYVMSNIMGTSYKNGGT